MIDHIPSSLTFHASKLKSYSSGNSLIGPAFCQSHKETQWKEWPLCIDISPQRNAKDNREKKLNRSPLPLAQLIPSFLPCHDQSGRSDGFQQSYFLSQHFNWEFELDGFFPTKGPSLNQYNLSCLVLFTALFLGDDGGGGHYHTLPEHSKAQHIQI